MLPLWLVVRLVVGYFRKERDEKFSISRELFFTAFFIYAIVVAAMTIAPTANSINNVAGFNLIPFHSLSIQIQSLRLGPAGEIIFELENLIGNLFLLFPLGIFLPLTDGRFQKTKTFFLTALTIAGSIELIQFISQYFGSFRVADIDDVILNTAGACLGFWIFWFVKTRSKRQTAFSARLASSAAK